MDTDFDERSDLSVQLAGQSRIFHHDGFRVMTMRALKRASVITGLLVGFDPRKSHRSATFRARLTVDLWNWREINL